MALRTATRKLGSRLLPMFSSASALHSHATSFGFREAREGQKSQMVGNVFSSVASNYDLTNDFDECWITQIMDGWAVAAGGFLRHSAPLYATGVEVSPLCSYAGENLDPTRRGRTFHAPCEITL